MRLIELTLMKNSVINATERKILVNPAQISHLYRVGDETLVWLVDCQTAAAVAESPAEIAALVERA